MGVEGSKSGELRPHDTDNQTSQVDKDVIFSSGNSKEPTKRTNKYKLTSSNEELEPNQDDCKPAIEDTTPEGSMKHRNTSDRRLEIRPVCTIVREPRRLEFFDPTKDCPICQEQFRSERVFRSHLADAHKGSSFELEPLLSFDPRNLKVEFQLFKLLMVKLSQAVPRFLIKIRNQCTVPVLLNSIYVFDGNVKFIPIFSGNQVLRMVPKYSFEEEVTLDDLVLIEGRSYSLIITATPVSFDKVVKQQVVEQYHFSEKAGKSLGPRTPIKFRQLPPFEIPRSVVVLYKSNLQTNDAYTAQEHEMKNLVDYSQKARPTLNMYKELIHMLNLLEAQHLLQEFNDYTLVNPVLTTKPNSKLYSVSIDQFKKRPSLLNEEVRVKFITEDKRKMKEPFGVVDKVTTKEVTFLMQQTVDVKNVVKVMFILNRNIFQLEKNALDLLNTSLIQSICFPTVDIGINSPLNTTSAFEWIRPSVATNKEQMIAVKNIVNQTSFPAPYILFGPPGTGKTSTLVEAIGQIYRLRPTANILVAAPSNFAANELTSRLLDVIPDESIFRYFASSCMRKLDEIDGDVIEVSNISGRRHRNLCYEDIYMCRVVVTTQSMAGKLVQADIVQKHFSYVFIDECGSAKEISSLIPIAGLATNESGNIHASIVLAGDPKQLGPVIQYDFLKQTSHSVSMLERMMALPFYSKDPISKEYNPRTITQLRDNFRSHDKLLQFCNDQFYDGLLRAKAPVEIKSLALGWYRLPNRRCPLIFYPVDGKMKRDEITSSMSNEAEARQVMFYVKDLLENGINGKPIQQSDIGIVSPYARQVMFLRMLCRCKEWTDIEIGSAEQYQGREKAIIIISTVRSGCGTIGFLSDVKRLNVALTRARSLMIVVGNPSTLEQDPTWKQFIEYCRENGAIAQPKEPSNRNANKRRKPKAVVHETPSYTREQIGEIIDSFYNFTLD